MADAQSCGGVDWDGLFFVGFVGEVVGEVDFDGRTYHGVNDETYSYEYEWNGEELAHVEGHVGLEAHLRILDELDEETAGEEHGEEHSEDEARASFGVFLPIHPHKEHEEREIASRLIELCGMAGKSGIFVATDEDEAPGEGGGMAVDFRVHQVAETNHGTDKRDGNGESVKGPERISACGDDGEEDDGNHDADGSAVACKAAFPDGENFGWMHRIIVPFVEEDVSETSADDRTGSNPKEEYAEPTLRSALMAEDFVHDVVAYPEADGEH